MYMWNSNIVLYMYYKHKEANELQLSTLFMVQNIISTFNIGIYRIARNTLVMYYMFMKSVRFAFVTAPNSLQLRKLLYVAHTQASDWPTNANRPCLQTFYYNNKLLACRD